MFQSQESFGLFILGLIIISDVVIILAVLWAGSQHDSHHISPTGSSAAVTKLREVYNFPEAQAASQASLPAETVTTTESAVGTADSVSS